MKKQIWVGVMGMMLLSACKGEQEVQKDTFDYTVEQFADLQLLRYKVHGFEEVEEILKHES